MILVGPYFRLVVKSEKKVLKLKYPQLDISEVYATKAFFYHEDRTDLFFSSAQRKALIHNKSGMDMFSVGYFTMKKWMEKNYQELR